MLYCEKCQLLTQNKFCPKCKNKKLREVKDDDFCFFVSMDALSFEMFESSLQSINIDVVGLPFYTHAVTMSSAGRAQGRAVFIRFKDLQVARQTYQMLFGDNT